MLTNNIKRVTAWAWVAVFLASILVQPTVHANGIYRDGFGAQSMAMGGANTAWAADPLGAMTANPAGLGFLIGPQFNLGFMGAITEGTFSKGTNSNGSLDNSLRALPEAAFGIPLKNTPVTLGISFVADSLMLADWTFNDPPGGLGGNVSYGVQRHDSEIILLRPALGAAVRMSSKLSFGVSVGLLYNENTLHTPYTFQNLQPSSDAPYNGAKTLLDLHTSGFGWNVQAGLLYKPFTNLQAGLSYLSPSRLYTTGDASGDPYAQFGVSPGPLAFHYNADVRNVFPQEVSVGLSWKPHQKWRVAGQLDWINWSDAFRTLPVKLSNGTAPVSGVLGSTFQDNIPLNWQDQFVYRLGLEYAVLENLFLRAGYAYGASPVPNSTLTPMTAAIMEHTLTAGVGYQWGNWTVDLAYQYDLPVTRNVGASGLLSGEYSNSSTEVSVHVIALTASMRF
jgi:long-chain fatty acid transport protein